MLGFLVALAPFDHRQAESSTMKFLKALACLLFLAAPAAAEQDLNLDFSMTLQGPELKQMFKEFETEFDKTTYLEVSGLCRAAFGWAATYLGQNNSSEEAKDSAFLVYLFTVFDLTITGIHEGASAAVERSEQMQDETTQLSKELKKRFRNKDIADGPVIIDAIQTCMKGVLYWSMRMQEDLNN